MPSVANPTFNVQFDLVGVPKIRLTDTTQSPPAGMVGIFEITQPDGYVRQASLDSPDVTSGGSFEYTLSLDSIGQLQCGNYIIKYTVAAPGYLPNSLTREFPFSYEEPSIQLTKNFDLFTPNLSYTDSTSYAKGGYTNSSVLRSWIVTSQPTGTLTGSGATISLGLNNIFYDAQYSVSLVSTVTYTSTSYAWLSIIETVSKTETADACTPKPLEDLVGDIEDLRKTYIECNGDFPKFEKAQTLFSHLIDMLRLLLVGGIDQSDVIDVYDDLLGVLYDGSAPSCVHTNQAIPPYDFSQYEVDPFTGETSYCITIGNNSTSTFNINHGLNDECVLVQVYEVSTGIQVFTEVSIIDKNVIRVRFDGAPSTNQYKVVVLAGKDAVIGDAGPPGPAGPPGSTIVSPTPPANPTVGLQWFNSSNGTSYIYYDGYWVQDANSGLIATLDGLTIEGGTAGSIYLQTQVINAGNA